MVLEAASHGVSVKGLILIDTPYPVNHKPLPQPIIEHISSLSSSSSNNLRAKTLRQQVQAQFSTNAGMLSHFQHPARALPVPAVIIKCADTFNAQGLCGVRYPWLDDETTRNKAIARWKGLLQQNCEVLETSGNHFEPFNAENVRSLDRVTTAFEWCT